MKLKTQLLLALSACLLASASQAMVINLEASLDGGQEVGPVMTNATGEATVAFDSTQNLVSFNLTVSGISLADITFPGGPLIFGVAGPVHLHNGAAGTNGGVILPFNDAAFYTATLQGFSVQANDLTAPAGFAALLASDSVYVNVHTLTNGAGEIRGQLSSVPEPTSIALFGLAGMGLLLRRRQLTQA